MMLARVVGKTDPKPEEEGQGSAGIRRLTELGTERGPVQPTLWLRRFLRLISLCGFDCGRAWGLPKPSDFGL